MKLLPCLLFFTIVIQTLGEDFDYILWNGHRFARTSEDVERDVAYFRDLGFNYSFIGNLSAESSPARNPEKARALFASAKRHGLKLGVRIGFERETESLAQLMGLTETQMIEKGILLSKKPPSGKPQYNPMHPEVIRFYRDAFAKQVEELLKYDSGGQLKMFLIGTEMGWPLPRTNADAHPVALQQILEMAAKDGVKAESVADIRSWWVGPHQKGGDWKLREAIESAILEQVPDATFWVDPVWAIKIVNGYGGDWSYVRDDPKRIIPGLVNTMAMTRPAPAVLSTQLTRLSGFGKIPHDVLLEANLISLCLGIDKLYHWGIQTFEPGTDPFYGKKDLKRSPEGFPVFAEDHIKDWSGLIAVLSNKLRSPQVEKIWSLLGKEAQAAISSGSLDSLLDGDLFADPGKKKTEVAPAIKTKVLAAMNDLGKDSSWTQSKVFARIVSGDKRVSELSTRDYLGPEDHKELSRLVQEKVFGPVLLVQTRNPNTRELWETVDYRRSNLEPAIRTTGRLLQYRGELFSRWKPLGDRVALLGGIFSGRDLKTGLAVGHIPYDLLRNQKDRRLHLKNYRFVAAIGKVSAEDYKDLLAMDGKGAVVLLPEGFPKHEDQTELKNTVTWKVPKDSKSKLAPHELRQHWHKVAQDLKQQFHAAGVQPYVDSNNLDVIVQGYEDGENRLVFTVNDKRTYLRHKVLEDQGVENEVEFLIKDDRKDLQAIDIDTGRIFQLQSSEKGWVLKDTLPAAWYRIYLITPKGTKSPYPILPEGPAISNLQTKRTNQGHVQLSWTLPDDNWVGAGLQTYRIFRSDGKDPGKMWEISARPLRGGGGILTQYVDESAEAEQSYRYQIQAITALRRDGPISKLKETEN